MEENKALDCQRCGDLVQTLYPIDFKDDFGLIQTVNVCWDCDHEIMNGKGDILEDEYEIHERREEEEYFNDPVNNSPPWFMS